MNAEVYAKFRKGFPFAALCAFLQPFALLEKNPNQKPDCVKQSNDEKASVCALATSPLGDRGAVILSFS